MFLTCSSQRTVQHPNKDKFLNYNLAYKLYNEQKLRKYILILFLFFWKYFNYFRHTQTIHCISATLRTCYHTSTLQSSPVIVNVLFVGLQVCYEIKRGGRRKRENISRLQCHKTALKDFLKCIQFIVINGVGLQIRHLHCIWVKYSIDFRDFTETVQHITNGNYNHYSFWKNYQGKSDNFALICIGSNPCQMFRQTFFCKRLVKIFIQPSRIYSNYCNASCSERHKGDIRMSKKQDKSKQSPWTLKIGPQIAV
jgi:hypothetical protein